MERLKKMNVSLGSTNSNPMDIGIKHGKQDLGGLHQVAFSTVGWDGPALLYKERASMLTMANKERVISKVEKKASHSSPKPERFASALKAMPFFKSTWLMPSYGQEQNNLPTMRRAKLEGVCELSKSI